ncbi:hypothetical protein [Klebsiella huaxiensis]|nr:hypothetical protein [Klebsiella huaxiensis]
MPQPMKVDQRLATIDADLSKNTAEGYDKAYYSFIHGFDDWGMRVTGLQIVGRNNRESKELKQLKEVYPQAFGKALEFARKRVEQAKTTEEKMLANLYLLHTNTMWTKYTDMKYALLSPKANAWVVSVTRSQRLPEQSVKQAKEKLGEIFYAKSKVPVEFSKNDDAIKRYHEFVWLYLTWLYDQPDINGALSPSLKADLLKAYNRTVVNVVVRNKKDFRHDGVMVNSADIIPAILKNSLQGEGKPKYILPFEQLLQTDPDLISYKTGSVRRMILMDYTSRPSPTGINYFLDISIAQVLAGDKESHDRSTNVYSVGTVDCEWVANEDYHDDGDRRHKKRHKKSKDRDDNPRYVKTCVDNRGTAKESINVVSNFKSTDVKYSWQIKNAQGKVEKENADGYQSSRSEGSKTKYVEGSKVGSQYGDNSDPTNDAISQVSKDIMEHTEDLICTVKGKNACIDFTRKK